MAGLATVETNRSVTNFIDGIGDPAKEEDCYFLVSILKEITSEEPKVWGNERVPDFMIGFGKYRYQNKGSKKKLEWFKVGITPRQNRFTIHLNFTVQDEIHLVEELGKCKWGTSCIYFNQLSDISLDVLIQLIDRSLHYSSSSANRIDI